MNRLTLMDMAGMSHDEAKRVPSMSVTEARSIVESESDAAYEERLKVWHRLSNEYDKKYQEWLKGDKIADPPEQPPDRPKQILPKAMDQSNNPTVVEYAVQYMMRGKSIATAVKNTVEKLHSHENMLIGPGITLIDASKLETALWNRLVDDTIKHLGTYTKPHFSLDATLNHFNQVKNGEASSKKALTLRKKLKSLVVKKMGRNPFPDDVVEACSIVESSEPLDVPAYAVRIPRQRRDKRGRIDRSYRGLWYVAHLPGEGGVDWGYSSNGPGKGTLDDAKPLSPYWQRRFKADMQRLGDSASFTPAP